MTTHESGTRLGAGPVPLLVYFSSVSGNTARFVEKLTAAQQDAGHRLRSIRIPLHSTEQPLVVHEPFVLVTPTYGGGQGRGEERGAVPKQVIRFLNDERNRSLIRGVISTGNTNFGEHFGLAGDIISRKCHVPHLYRLELFGTPEDVERVSRGMERWWKQH
ncbi:MAG TPA: class Ib ribonucleoside-diphosphate reductase assembly flavoprotein NrdI [Microbacterium sp.]|uniref:class Ib ribonucleoside-diphosphate reductase assembly flavoprotein NrdI n=1 Tax=Microbacterium sp. TaxID=51671 RepID=UPI002B49EF05|nr:class Ib ribonucleoside-diphosphate reductase assembly flavoprotein NrdI [Microbacterium sp.]HKT57297.1 class Ib ribonucleoside-diphosphate reductase assembly flavoprotein NrdI [Microbacterium sp.]